jgi:DNA adenine methylase
MTRGGGTAIEHLWFNFDPPTELHDYRYLGEGFKKREWIRLKAQRWRKKFEKLPVLERKAILKELLEVDEPYPQNQ